MVPSQATGSCLPRAGQLPEPSFLPLIIQRHRGVDRASELDLPTYRHSSELTLHAAALIAAIKVDEKAEPDF